jgi:hypothetical protein
MDDSATLNWSEISREERFFTCLLFHEIRKHDEGLKNGPFLSLVRSRLRDSSEPIGDDVELTEVGFEVCFFRDLFAAGKISKKDRFSPKETFDLVLFLSDGTIIIIEAKAHQGFRSEQLETLKAAKKTIEERHMFGINRVCLVALHSSLYSPKSETFKNTFCFSIKWKDVTELSKENKTKKLYNHADALYKKK